MDRPSLLPRPNRSRWVSQFGLGIAALIGWILIVASFQSFLDFRTLLYEGKDWFRDDLVFLNKEVRLTDSIGLSDSEIDMRLLDKIRAVDGIAFAEPVYRNDFAAAVQIGGGVFPTIYSEIFLEAVPLELFVPEVAEWQWQEGDALVPILIPRQFLNLYNFGFAPGKGLPPVSEETAKRVRFSLLCYPTSGGSPEVFTASIAGFSDRIESIVVPLSFLAYANQRFGRGSNETYGRAAIALTNPDSAEFHRLLEDNRLRAGRDTRETARLRMLLDLCLVAFGSAGVIILLLNLLLFLADIETSISDHRSRIEKLYFLGYTPSALARRLVFRKIVGLGLPALVGLAFAWYGREKIIQPLSNAGIEISPHIANLTILLWTILIFGSAFWLITRIQSRLKGMYR